MELKFEYTENNHFKWGWGDEWYNRPDPTKPFRIHLGYTKRPVKRFREECIEVARQIAQKATKPICIGLSGGSDSQMACLSFMELGVEFKVVIVKLIDINGEKVNHYDINNAYRFCDKYNIEYIEHDIILDDFYKNKGSVYAEKYGLTNIHTLIQCDTMDFICPNYCYVMAGGDVVFSLYKNSEFPFDEPQEVMDNCRDFVGPVWWQSGPPIMQHMMEMGYEGTSKFYLYTPEIIASYLTDNVVTDFLRTKDTVYSPYITWFKTPWIGNKSWQWKLFHLIIKPLMTTREWPEMVLQRKYTGFELLHRAVEGRNIEKEYYELIQNAAGSSDISHVICPRIEELIEYVTTPHTHFLTSKRHVLPPRPEPIES